MNTSKVFTEDKKFDINCYVVFDILNSTLYMSLPAELENKIKELMDFIADSYCPKPQTSKEVDILSEEYICKIKYIEH